MILQMGPMRLMWGGEQGAAEGGSYADAIYGHTTDSALLLAAGLMQLLVNKMAFLLLPFDTNYFGIPENIP